MIEPGKMPELEELAGRLAISEILALHCRGVDRADAATLKACYWPDATTAYGSDPVPAIPFCEQLAQSITAFDRTHHMVTNMVCDFRFDEAKVESSVIAFHYLSKKNGNDSEMTYLGRYLDRFERRNKIWKIKHREPVMSWSQNTPASHDAGHPALSALRKAARYPEDLIYISDWSSNG